MDKSRDLIYQYGLFFFIVNNMRDDFSDNKNETNIINITNNSEQDSYIDKSSILNDNNNVRGIIYIFPYLIKIKFY